MDNTKLVGKVYSERLSNKQIQMVTGSKGTCKTTLGSRDLTISQLGRFCSLFKCQPSDLLSLGENECVKYMKSKKDYSKLWARQDCNDHKFSRITGIPYMAVVKKTELSMPVICIAAFKLGCKISDLVDMEDK